ncbi:AAA family ATPase [Candidatus Pacearchaeota archaeon]|nr:AAA family ATPase [Candidatus Pacearchaeota archaeon]
MLIKKIKIINIRSYEQGEIVIPSGAVLLSGDIGSGKTSILLAIEFALFGLQPGQKGNSILRNGADDGFVELEFEINGKNIIIKRTLKRKKSVAQEEAFITIGGKTEEKSITEMKTTILSMLNYPGEFAKKTNLLYRFTVYTPQEQMKQIILETPEIRLNTLRHVFGIDKYKRIKENTQILTLKLREISRLKQGQISELEFIKLRLAEKKQDINSIKALMPNMEKSLSAIIALKEKKQADVLEVKEKIAEKQKFEKECEKTDILLMAKKDSLSKSNSEILFIKRRFEEAVKNFNQNEFDLVIKSISDKKTSLDAMKKETILMSERIRTLNLKKSELDALKNKIANLKECPTCLQEVSSQHKVNIIGEAEKEMLSLNNEKIGIDNEKQLKEKEINLLEKEVFDFEKKREALNEVKIRLKTIEEDQSKLSALGKQKIELENDVKMLSEQIIRLKEAVSSMKKYDSVLSARENEFAEIMLEEKKLDIKKAEIIREIELGNKEIKLLEISIAEKEKIKNELVHISEIEGWFSNQFLEMVGFIERNVMLKLRGEFSRLFSEWFSILVPETFSVRLDDDFTPVIEQQDYELDYSYLSGGERTAIALAYRLALNQTINSLISEIKTKGLVILDEPTDGFSQQQLDKMRDVLNELNMEQLIIVSHDQKIESFVQHVIHLKKDGGKSVVVG